MKHSVSIETLTFDQVHLGVPDPGAAAQWYVRHLGAAPGDNFDRIWFGPARVIFLKNEAPAPSRGAAIDHFALSCTDVRAEVAALDGSGARVTTAVSEAPGLGRYAYVEDPWGARIQLVEEPGAPRFHHVHLQVPDPAATRGWYLERFGGERAALKGTLDGIRYGDVWLFLDRGANEPSRGHAIDHIGFRMPDLLARAAALKTMGGLTFTTDPKPGPPGAFSPALMSFAEDPWGVKIELLQRRA
ncbi:MAG: VOC family protein [Acidobacteria bacterium]|nr:VOC family protein [Acidobacteriota bacterium]